MNHWTGSFINFILILAISTWLGWLTYTNNQSQLTSSQLVSHSGQVLLASEKLFNALLNIETSQRGYDNTNKEELLTPYYAYRDSVDYHFQILQKLIADSPRQQQSLTKLKPLLDETRYNPMRSDQKEIFRIAILATEITSRKRNEAGLVRLLRLPEMLKVFSNPAIT